MEVFGFLGFLHHHNMPIRRSHHHMLGVGFKHTYGALEKIDKHHIHSNAHHCQHIDRGAGGEGIEEKGIESNQCHRAQDKGILSFMVQADFLYFL